MYDRRKTIELQMIKFSHRTQNDEQNLMIIK